MKKVLLLLSVILIFTLVSCGYSKEDLIRAENEGYQTGFEEGYDLAKYESRGEIERIKSEDIDTAYEYGYEHGYEIGYEDGYYDRQDWDSSFDPDNVPRIEKDRE